MTLGRWTVQALFLIFIGSSPALALPPIHARSFRVELERKSTSGKVLLLKSSGHVPAKGQIVLLYDDVGPIVVLRARALYQEHRFAAQIIRDYSRNPEFKIGSTYRAKLKVRDIEITDEEAQPIPPNDLDVEFDPSRFNDRLSPNEEIELDSLIVEEIDDYEQESSLLAYRISILRMPGFEKGWIFPAATGIRLSQTVAHPIFLEKKKIQDALSIDLNLQFTRLIDYTSLGGDSFTMMPITLSGRYTLYTSSSFCFFGYAGGTQMWSLEQLVRSLSSR